jgi:hypothetical protein
MSDGAMAPRRAFPTAILAAALASTLLYASIFLSFAFLIPVQIAFGRSGQRGGWAAAGLSAGGIATAQAVRLALAGAFGAANLAALVLPPMVLLAALGLVNAPFARDLAPIYRTLGAAALCALAALPFIATLDADAALRGYLEGQITSFLAPLKGAAGEGYEASALAAALDPKELVATGLSALRASFAALLFLLIGGSWRLGSRLAGRDGRGAAVPIDELRLPYPLLWAFLGSWGFVLAAEFLRGPEAVRALAWNCALALSLAYAVQGIGIATFVLKGWKLPRSLRVATAILAVMALFAPTTGIVVAVSLPLLGVTENWIPYRKPKGVGA